MKKRNQPTRPRKIRFLGLCNVFKLLVLNHADLAASFDSASKKGQLKQVGTLDEMESDAAASLRSSGRSSSAGSSKK